MSCDYVLFFFSSRRRHTRCGRDWSSDVCSSDLNDRSRIGGILDDREDEPRIVGPCVVVQSGAREFLARDLRLDRKSVVKGKSVDLGGRRIIKKKKNRKTRESCDDENDR